MTNILDTSKAKPFTQGRLAELAEDEENKVYDWEYDKVDRVMPAEEVRLKLLGIRGLVQKNKKENPDWKWADHKKFIQENHPILWDMTKTHPKMFAVASHPQTDVQRDFAPMLMLIQNMKDVQEGRISEKRAMEIVSTNLQEHLKLKKGQTKDDVTPWTVETRPG